MNKFLPQLKIICALCSTTLMHTYDIRKYYRLLRLNKNKNFFKIVLKMLPSGVSSVLNNTNCYHE